MERLTERDGSGYPVPKELNVNNCACQCIMVCEAYEDVREENICIKCPVQHSFSKLADYEDAEDHGQLIKLPVPIGGTLYEAYYCEGYGIIEWTIRGYEIDGAKMYFRADDGTSIDVSEIGDEFFETREQAEAKLVEWEKEWEKQNGQIDKT